MSRSIRSIFFKELKSYFYSPIAYVLYTIYYLITGYFFFQFVKQYNDSASAAASAMLNINEHVISPFFLFQGSIFILLIPIITMRLFADENRFGTIELIMTVPVHQFLFILGKFLACFAFFCIMLSGTCVYYFILNYFGNPELLPILTGLLGCLLLGSALLAMGIFASSVTQNQIIAAIITFGLILSFWLIGISSDFSSSFIGKSLGHISAKKHFDGFCSGIISISDIVYYISHIVFWLFLTNISLDSRRWREI